jgi:hypothetical protein
MDREIEFIYESHENIVQEDTGFPALAIVGTRADTGRKLRIISGEASSNTPDQGSIIQDLQSSKILLKMKNRRFASFRSKLYEFDIDKVEPISR